MTVEHARSEKLNGAHAAMLLGRQAQELRDSWQARLMAHTSGRDAAIVMVVIAHNWFDAMDTLCRVVWPGFMRLNPPMLSGPAKISKGGQVYCDMINRDKFRVPNVVLFDSQDALIGFFRRLADVLKFSDKDRAELFMAVQNWVVADYRVNENAEKVV